MDEDIFGSDLFDVFENKTLPATGPSAAASTATSDAAGTDDSESEADEFQYVTGKSQSESETIKEEDDVVRDEAADMEAADIVMGGVSEESEEEDDPDKVVLTQKQTFLKEDVSSQESNEPEMEDLIRVANEEEPSSSKSSELTQGIKRTISEVLANDGEEHLIKKELPKLEDSEPDTDDPEESKKRKTDISQLKKYIPKVKLQTLETVEGGGCTHVVAIPENSYYIPLHPIENPVKEYPFKLDVFQQRAVMCVDNYQSVLISAHTSAGKTVVAEYAIAKGLKDKQRVIYTTPIKALSNQKYREFYEEFKDVGLITGDVTISPSASCLIMTTEILRNMLYRGSEIMREVGWVIFDEIHYMRDKERGVVWEETIILLPQKTHYVFLSATIPNAIQFAEWICHLHKQPCNVIHTEYRPVPLHHYIYPVGGDGIHLVVDDQGVFHEDRFNNAMAMLQTPSGTGRPQRRPGKGEDSACHKVIKMAMEHDLAPVIVFSFSKKDCELFALQLSKLDFNNADEKNLVEEIFTNAIDVLSKEDQKLPQVENLLPLLKRGIGIHHGGLLPLLKETIEILFSEGLLKVLFATETFAMGLNMPARTVLFTNVRKYDGKDYRWISSGEYIQMSGRAGRRGIDDKGVTIVMIDEKISSNVGRALFKGAADPINSAFHLTYNMVLNLMRVEEINPEYMMERSFYQFQHYSNIPEILRKLKEAEEAYQAIIVPREAEASTYYDLRKQLLNFSEEFRSFITRPKYLLPFLQPGRLIYVKNGDHDFGWGAVVDFKKKENTRENPMNATTTYLIEVLMQVVKQTSDTGAQEVVPASQGNVGEMRVVPVACGAIQKISQVRLYLPNDLRPLESRNNVKRAITEVLRRYPDGPPVLDPVGDMKIKENSFLELVKNIAKFEARLIKHPLHKDPKVAELYETYHKKVKLHQAVVDAKSELKKAKSLIHMDELKCRKRVLRRLGYASNEDVIDIKGRVACELTSGDELLLSEMIFDGLFIDLDVAKSVALLSCLVCDERSNDVPKLSEELSEPLKQMQKIARHIAKVSKESKLEIVEEEYVDQFKPYLMDVVYDWCKGASFSDLCSKTDIFEGGIIRCMRRLEELLRQMSLAAKVIGNKELEDKFNQGVKLIKRDIVFAASLYL